VHAALADAVRAAVTAYRAARRSCSRAELAEQVADGADGTPTMRVDALIEDAVAESTQRNGVNLLSEEAGYLDHGSAVTLVVDPVDGSANAASGVPLSCFAGVVALDGAATEAITCWLDTGRCWYARAGERTPYRTTGRTALAGASVCLLRPHERSADAWWRVAHQAGRIRVPSTSCLEIALVAEGSIDAFADPGSDTHRIVDLAAALVTVPAARCVRSAARTRPRPPGAGVAAATPQLAEELAATISAGVVSP
jgi:myo-inositol-1(or 4)-monophosphatase